MNKRKLLRTLKPTCIAFSALLSTSLAYADGNKCSDVSLGRNYLSKDPNRGFQSGDDSRPGSFNAINQWFSAGGGLKHFGEKKFIMFEEDGDVWVLDQNETNTNKANTSEGYSILQKLMDSGMHVWPNSENPPPPSGKFTMEKPEHKKLYDLYGDTFSWNEEDIQEMGKHAANSEFNPRKLGLRLARGGEQTQTPESIFDDIARNLGGVNAFNWSMTDGKTHTARRKSSEFSTADKAMAMIMLSRRIQRDHQNIPMDLKTESILIATKAGPKKITLISPEGNKENLLAWYSFASDKISLVDPSTNNVKAKLSRANPSQGWKIDGFQSSREPWIVDTQSLENAELILNRDREKISSILSNYLSDLEYLRTDSPINGTKEVVYLEREDSFASAKPVVFKTDYPGRIDQLQRITMSENGAKHLSFDEFKSKLESLGYTCEHQVNTTVTNEFTDRQTQIEQIWYQKSPMIHGIPVITGGMAHR